MAQFQSLINLENCAAVKTTPHADTANDARHKIRRIRYRPEQDACMCQPRKEKVTRWPYLHFNECICSGTSRWIMIKSKLSGQPHNNSVLTWNKSKSHKTFSRHTTDKLCVKTLGFMNKVEKFKENPINFRQLFKKYILHRVFKKKFLKISQNFRKFNKIWKIFWKFLLKSFWCFFIFIFEIRIIFSIFKDMGMIEKRQF